MVSASAVAVLAGSGSSRISVTVAAGGPVAALLGPRADEHEHARLCEGRRDLLDERLRLRVGPLEIFDDEHQRRAPALGGEQLAHALENPPPPLHRLERGPVGVVGGDVAEGQDRGDAAREARVERHHARRDLLADPSRVVTVLDVEVLRQQIAHGQIGGERAVRHARRLVHLPAAGCRLAAQLPHEP
jgi:hypothetical protein